MNSFDRKPFPGMLIKACNKHNINPAASAMIGDKVTDKEAAHSAGIRHFFYASNSDLEKSIASLA